MEQTSQEFLIKEEHTMPLQWEQETVAVLCISYAAPRNHDDLSLLLR
jgi:hypothetical protein